jgi:hypothetical protein
MATTGQRLESAQTFSAYSNRGATGITKAGTMNSQLNSSLSLNTQSTPSITKIAFKSGTLTASSTVDLNLTDGSMEDLSGVSGVVFTEIHSIAVAITTGTTMTIGGTVANVNKLWFSDNSDSQQIELDGYFFLQGGPTPIAVSGSTNKIRLTAGSSDCDYVYIICGN